MQPGSQKRFVTDGVEAALGRKEQVNRHKKVDGRVEAHIIAIACSEAPEGRERWTLQLIADELVLLLQLKIGKHRTAEKIGYKLGLMLQFPHE